MLFKRLQVCNPVYIRRRLFLILLCLVMAGCATRASYDYSALMESSPASILVLPAANNSVEVNAPYIFMSTISRPLAEKGYYVFPVEVIDRLMKENGVSTPEEMHQIPLDKLNEVVGADAVLYTEINDWGQRYQVFSSVSVVDADMRLVDTKTGALLWNGRAHAQQSSGDGGGGLVGALVAAAVTQITGSLNDLTPNLSRRANNLLIKDKNIGLLNGPYRPVVEESAK